MTDTEFKNLAEIANTKTDVQNVGELLTWLQQFPKDTQIWFEFAQISAELEQDKNNQTQHVVLISETL